MAVYLSILKGINVGGQKKILMADLKQLYENLNLKKVKTFIQSGNVIFEAKNDKQLSKRIEQKIFENYNFNVPVILRTIEEMEQILTKNPFLKEKNSAPEKLYVTYLAEHPAEENISKIKNTYGPDQFCIIGKEVFLYYPNAGYGTTKLTNNFFENKLKVTATTRNWKTTNELLNIMKTY